MKPAEMSPIEAYSRLQQLREATRGPLVLLRACGGDADLYNDLVRRVRSAETYDQYCAVADYACGHYDSGTGRQVYASGVKLDRGWLVALRRMQRGVDPTYDHGRLMELLRQIEDLDGLFERRRARDWGESERHVWSMVHIETGHRVG